jgi:Tfp pilus assembly protein PilN
MGSDNTISLSGRADAYNDVQDFTNKLLEQDMFTEVSLKSVGLEDRDNTVNYFIVVTYKAEALNG